MSDPKVKIKIDYKKCDPKRCNNGICSAVLSCPVKLIKQMEPFDYPYPLDGFCQECGKCIDSCLLEAIKMK